MSQLYFIFSNTKSQPQSLRLKDGKLNIYKRSQSAQWQCRFKLSNGKWHSASCGTEDIEQAKIQAITLYETIKIKIDNGLAITTKTFKQIANDEIFRMSKAASTKRSIRNYKDYFFILEKYLIPFFGNYTIDTITEQTVADFDAWRLAEMGKDAKAMTKKHHAMAFNRIVTKDFSCISGNADSSPSLGGIGYGCAKNACYSREPDARVGISPSLPPRW